MSGRDTVMSVEPLLLTADLVGVFAFAVSGNLLAARKNVDILGSLVLGMAVGLGGGIMRDVILGRIRGLTQLPGLLAEARARRSATFVQALDIRFEKQIISLTQLRPEAT